MRTRDADRNVDQVVESLDACRVDHDHEGAGARARSIEKRRVVVGDVQADDEQG